MDMKKSVNSFLKIYLKIFYEFKRIQIIFSVDWKIVGDSLFIDSPQLPVAQKAKAEVDPQSGGLYIIRDLCHYMTSTETYTRINAIRDSVGRKGTASS